MPIYQNTKTYRGGFYNNSAQNGVNDRVYSAEDVRKPYDTVFTDGVKPDEEGSAGDNLKVLAEGGMAISVSAGHAKLGGAWFENTAPYNITLDSATSTVRYDCVILQNNDNENVRAASIYIKSLESPPTLGNLTRAGKIYEVCIAYIKVPAYAESIDDDNIVDTREDGELCQLMTGVGATVTKTYRNTYYSTNVNQSVIPIGIKQFSKGHDVLRVMVEGVVMPPSTYVVNSSSEITLAVALPVVGTRVDFEVTRNVNGRTSADATAEYTQMLEDVAAHNKFFEHHYYCNGASDNIEISNIVSEFLGGDDYGSMKLIVHGQIGVSAPHSGSGTSTSPYLWFRIGAGGSTKRKAYVDFSDSSPISINCSSGTYNCIFFGLYCDVIGANVIATGGESITVFSTPAATRANATDCRFWITSKAGYIARGGTFRDCRVSFTTTASNACAFNVLKGGLLRLFGGEYYAFATGSYWSTIVYVSSAQTDSSNGAVVNTYSINCPQSDRSGYVQKFAINCLTEDGRCSFTDTITKLEVTAEKQNIRGTIPANLPTEL